MEVRLWALTSALAWGSCVLLWWRPAPLTRLRVGGVPDGLSMPRLLRPRPGALSGRVRGIVGIGVGLVAFLWTEPAGLALAGLAAGVAGASSTIALGHLEPASAVRTRERLLADLPQALHLLAACVGAGLPLRVGLRSVSAAMGGPVAAELDRVSALVAVGVAEPDAWLTLRDHPVLGSVARDVARAVDSGTAIQGALVRRAAELQADHRAAVEAKARAVGVRTVLPLSLCFLPAFFLLGIVPVVAGMLLPVLQP